ncbi:MAG: hypothetical protein KC561_08875, partial [Myxococcales bacterium]|nr:hypothetical protein [Myxococcales bacterium]
PSGVFCNDDYSGINPGIRRWLEPGRYLVFVGMYSYGYGVGGPGTPFTTTATYQGGEPPLDLRTLTEGDFGAVTLTYMGQETRAGTSGAGVVASTLSTTCVGQISEAPSYVLDMPAGTLDLRVMAESDLTITMVGEDGTVYCNDDYYGQNPAIYQ